MRFPIGEYYKALRAFTFSASVFPSLTGSLFGAMFVLGSKDDLHFSYLHCFLVLLGCIAIHSVSNLANDYFDFKSGLDSKENFGMKNPLVRGALTEGELKGEILFMFIVAVCVGAYFVYTCGMVIIYLMLFGALSAWFYSAPPFALKRRGLGDIQVVLSFGILMTVGSFITQAYNVFEFRNLESWLPFIVMLSLPQSLLINAILQANNHRDRESDAKHGARTIATRLSEKNSIRFQYILVTGAYILITVIALLTDSYFLLPLLSIPHAIKVLKNIHKKEQPGTQAFKLLVADAANLQRSFGGLMIISLILILWCK